MKTIFWLSCFGGVLSLVIFMLTIVYGFMVAKSESDYRVRAIYALYGGSWFIAWRYLFISITCFIIMGTV